MDLARFPRVRLCHSPTPLESLENLTKELGGPTLYIKRDDCTGLATGGNKTRKLEFLIGQALQQGVDTIITQGAVQSNHARQTAAAAAKFGLKCKILLERRVPNVALDYEQTGNVLLDRLFGAEIEWWPAGEDMNDIGRDVTEKVRQQGCVPYLIPGGGSNQVGALGYVNCAIEILQQANEQGLRIDYIVNATGSAGTQAGLVVGLTIQPCSPDRGRGRQVWAQMQDPPGTARAERGVGLRADGKRIARPPFWRGDRMVASGRRHERHRS